MGYFELKGRVFSIIKHGVCRNSVSFLDMISAADSTNNQDFSVKCFP